MLQNEEETHLEIKNIEIPLERDLFLRTLIRELSGTLQDIIGLEEASGFFNVVGQNMGDRLNKSYKNALKVEKLNKGQVGEVLIDLKRRIKGNFKIVEETDEKIVFHNSSCPFEEKVVGRPAMCMMTSNVFGSIAADNLDYSKVELNETIAEGDGRCVITIYINQSPESENANGREYFKGDG